MRMILIIADCSYKFKHIIIITPSSFVRYTVWLELYYLIKLATVNLRNRLATLLQYYYQFIFTFKRKYSYCFNDKLYTEFCTHPWRFVILGDSNEAHLRAKVVAISGIQPKAVAHYYTHASIISLDVGTIVLYLHQYCGVVSEKKEVSYCLLSEFPLSL